MTTGEYCRAVEAHLCRSNGGHLVRIAGPSFDRVCGWEARGIPLRVRCCIKKRLQQAQRLVVLDNDNRRLAQAAACVHKAPSVALINEGSNTLSASTWQRFIRRCSSAR